MLWISLFVRTFCACLWILSGLGKAGLMIGLRKEEKGVWEIIKSEWITSSYSVKFIRPITLDDPFRLLRHFPPRKNRIPLLPLLIHRPLHRRSPPSPPPPHPRPQSHPRQNRNRLPLRMHGISRRPRLRRGRPDRSPLP